MILKHAQQSTDLRIRNNKKAPRRKIERYLKDHFSLLVSPKSNRNRLGEAFATFEENKQVFVSDSPFLMERTASLARSPTDEVLHTLLYNQEIAITSR